jgi:hypothetical protein
MLQGMQPHVAGDAASCCRGCNIMLQGATFLVTIREPLLHLSAVHGTAPPRGDVFRGWPPAGTAHELHIACRSMRESTMIVAHSLPPPEGQACCWGGRL